MQLKCLTIVLLAVVWTVSADIVCTKDYCKKINCKKEGANKAECEKSGRVYKENASWCECCSACLTKLNLNDDCSSTFTREEPAKVECAPGLKCDIYTFKCIKMPEF